MTWPTTPVSTSNLDQGTDSPALARAQIRSAVDSVNAIAQEFGNVDLSAPSTNDVIAWDGAQWVAAAPSAGTTYTDANVATFLSTNFGSNTITTTGNITGGNIIGNGSSLTNTPEKTITLVGDATASGNTGSNVTVTLANTAVTAGTYGNATSVAQITIDSKGRITSAANVTITGGGGGTSGATAVFNLNRSTFTPGATFTSIGSNFTQLYNGTTITYSAGVFSIPAGTWLLEFAGVRATISGGSNPIDNTDFLLYNTTAAANLVTATTIPSGNDSSENYGHFIVCKPFTLSTTSNVEFQFQSGESATIRCQNVGIKFTQLA